MSYSNPVLLKALLTSPVEDAGVTPSGNAHKNGNGKKETSLGVHEH